jgi:hypothetical protein
MNVVDLVISRNLSGFLLGCLIGAGLLIVVLRKRR